MAILVHSDNGRIVQTRVVLPMALGSDRQSAVEFTAGAGVLPRHAVIVRSSRFHIPVLVNLASERWRTSVQDVPVVAIKALRHGDMIRLGEVTMTYWELATHLVKPGARVVGQSCHVCHDPIEPGDKVTHCPWCDVPHHADCWLAIKTCSLYGCGYPVQENLKGAFARVIQFEEVAPESPLTKETCRAGSERDRATFKTPETAAYCPQCQTPFHLECWLELRECTTCSCDFAALIGQAFVPRHIHTERDT